MKKCGVVFLFICINIAASAQGFVKGHLKRLHPDSLKALNLKLVPIPVLGISPETGLFIGASFSYFFKLEKKIETIKTRSSSLNVQYTYSIQKQSDLEGSWNLFLPNEKFIFRGQVGLVNFYDKFWGIGNIAPDERRTALFYKRHFIQNKALIQVRNRWFVGLNSRIQQIKEVTWNSGFYTTDTTIHGRNGSFSVGLGPLLIIDKRDNPFSSNKGYYAEFGYTQYSKTFGSNFDFSDVYLDLRKYFPLSQWKTVALQMTYQTTQGDIPFREYPRLGGSMINRGYFLGRYRNNTILSAQAEYRFPIWKIVHGSTFVSIASLGKNAHLDLNSPIYTSFGGGIRVLLNQKERIFGRLDLGMTTHGNKSLYMKVNDAF